MRGTDLVLIGLTFFTGVFCGAYLYVTVFAPSYQVGDEVVSVEDTSFMLMGQQYGLCDEEMAACDTFTLREDRSYTFAAGYVPTEPAPKDVTGKLERSSFDALREAVDTASFAALEVVDDIETCEGEIESVEYRYRLIYEGEEYFFDTCMGRFQLSGLNRAFEGVWEEVAVERTLLDDAGDVELSETVESFIDDTFQYDDR